MFFSHPNITSNSNQDFDEYLWVLHIRRTLEIDEIEEDHCDIPVSIFKVPKTQMAANPNSFVPQQIAIGPYHISTSGSMKLRGINLLQLKEPRKSSETSNSSIQ